MGFRDVGLPRPCGAILALSVVLYACAGGWAIAQTPFASSKEIVPLEQPDLGINGNVLSVLRVGDTLFVGGVIGESGRVRGSFLTVDSSRGMPEAISPGVGGAVQCALSDGHGGWYLGGKIVAVGGVRRFGLAHILADGRPNAWSPVVAGEIFSMAISNGQLVVGGNFSTIDGQPRRNLAAFELGSERLSPWHPDPDDWVLALHANGTTVYFGGYFREVGGVPRSHVAAWELAADSLASWAPEVSADVRAIETVDSTVYLGGRFFTVGEQPRPLLAAVSATDGRVLSWAPTIVRASPLYFDGGPRVSSIIAHEGSVYIGGSFDLVNGLPRVCLAKIDQLTGDVSEWNARSRWFFANELPPVNCLGIHANHLYVGGAFSELGGRDFGQARFDRTGFTAALDLIHGDATLWDPRLEAAPLAIQFSERGVVLGGEFRLAWDWVSRPGLLAVNLRTGTRTDWDPQLKGFVNALAANSTTLYVGGHFSRAGGVDRSNLAAFDLATGQLTPWDPSADIDVKVVAADDSIVRVGGEFHTIAGTARAFAAGLNPKSGELLPWDPAPDLAVQDILCTDNLIYLAGAFEHLGLQPSRGLGAVDPRTGAPHAFGAGVSFVATKLALRDTTLYVAGNFQTLDGAPRIGLGAVDARTGRVMTWMADLGADNPAEAFAYGMTATPEAIYAGGPFTKVAGRSRPFVVALDPSSGDVLDWEPGVDGLVSTISATSNTVLLGGRLTVAANRPTGALAAVPAYLQASTPPSYPTTRLLLRQNMPNPAFDLTSVRFSSPALGPAKVELFDLQGRALEQQSLNITGNTGEHQVFLRVRGLQPGCYVYRVTAGGETATKRMLVVR